MSADASTTFARNVHWKITKSRQDVTFAPCRPMVFSIQPRKLLQEWDDQLTVKTLIMIRMTVIKCQFRMREVVEFYLLKSFHGGDLTE